MASQPVHVGDVDLGVAVRVTNPATGRAVDLSAATAKYLYFRRPLQSTRRAPDIRAAVFVTDGTDGRVRYTTTAATDLNEPGEWRVWAVVTIAGKTFRTLEGVLTVLAN